MNTKINPPSLKKDLQVSVAVIHHDDDTYLLGYRNEKQHQGERYEFVGGKLECDETALQALIREVTEEIGITIESSSCHKMGEINHHYPEISVCLHVFAVSINDKQFKSMQNKEVGELGQPLVWVNKIDLLADKYHLPEANAEILSWLRNDHH